MTSQERMTGKADRDTVISMNTSSSAALEVLLCHCQLAKRGFGVDTIDNSMLLSWADGRGPSQTNKRALTDPGHFLVPQYSSCLVNRCFPLLFPRGKGPRTTIQRPKLAAAVLTILEVAWNPRIQAPVHAMLQVNNGWNSVILSNDMLKTKEPLQRT